MISIPLSRGTTPAPSILYSIQEEDTKQWLTKRIEQYSSAWRVFSCDDFPYQSTIKIGVRTFYIDRPDLSEFEIRSDSNDGKEGYQSRCYLFRRGKSALLFFLDGIEELVCYHLITE